MRAYDVPPVGFQSPWFAPASGAISLNKMVKAK